MDESLTSHIIMEIPQRIILNGVTYRVVNDNILKESSEYNDNYIGRKSSATATIRVDNTISKENQVLTFFHEVFHEIYDVVLCPLLGEEKAEHVTDSISRSFISILHANRARIIWSRDDEK